MSFAKKQKLTLAFIHQLALDLYFEIDDEQCHNLLLEFNAIQSQMESVIKIDTTGIKPLSYPLEMIKKSYLRPDNDIFVLPTERILDAAPSVFKDYITINRVVSDEN